jgi:phosphoribosylformimino-5-aminoimidazole carboxamide ribotide isomerase
MTRFRPCIDLHDGQVKQIVGGTLNDVGPGPAENFVSQQSARWFASKYRDDGLFGGHLIKLGPGNDAAAELALAEFPGGLQIGGGINLENASLWLDAGASHVILTSWLFDKNGQFRSERLDQLVAKIGREKIVVDLSCKRTGRGWTVAMNRWQTLTNLAITPSTLDSMADRCAEFLIHAADVEGLCQGIDVKLVRLMGDWGKIPMTYAGGVANLDDVKRVAAASSNHVDVTVGSSLDLFGGNGVKYDELLGWNRGQ